MQRRGPPSTSTVCLRRAMEPRPEADRLGRRDEARRRTGTSNLDVQCPPRCSVLRARRRMVSVSLPGTPLATASSRLYARANAPAAAGHDPMERTLDLAADPRAREPQAALEAGELYAAVAALPGDFRDVLVAVDITGLSYKETARALRIREGTVMSRLYRARQQVVRRIEAGSA